MGRTRQPFIVLQVKIAGVRTWVARIRDPRSGGKLRQRSLFVGAEKIPPSRQSEAKAIALAQAIADRWNKEADGARQTREADELAAAVITFGEFVELAKTDPGRPRKADSLSRRTVEVRNATIENFALFAGRHLGLVVEETAEQERENGALAEPITVITPELVRAFVVYKQTPREHGRRSRKTGDPVGCAASTIHRELTCIKRAFNWARELRKLPPGFENPVSTSDRRREITEHRERVEFESFTETEVTRILDAVRNGWSVTADVTDREGCAPYAIKLPVTPEPWFRLFVILLSELGLRNGELRQLTWSDVLWDRGECGMLRIPQRAAKTSARLLPLTALALQHLELERVRCARLVAPDRFLFPGSSGAAPIDRTAPRKAWERMLKALGIRFRVLHGLRHSYALRMCRLFPINVVAELMGHKDYETLRVYTRPDNESVAAEFLQKTNLLRDGIDPGAISDGAPDRRMKGTR